MSFFSDLKQAFKGSDKSEKDNQDTNNKSDDTDNEESKGISKFIIEKGMGGVKKLYEKKVDFINHWSFKEREWFFHEDQLVDDENNALIQHIITIQQKIESNESNIIKQTGKLEKEQESRSSILLRISSLQSSGSNADYERGQLKNSEEKIQIIEANISQLRSDILEINLDIKNSEYQIVLNTSLKENSSYSCYELLQKYDLLDSDDNYIKYGLVALSNWEQGRQDDAFNAVRKYFLSAGDDFNNFRLDEIYGRALLSEGNLVKSKEFISKAINKKPESRELHNILGQIHLALNENEDAETEQKIALLLE